MESVDHSVFQKCNGHPQSSRLVVRAQQRMEQNPMGLTVDMPILFLPSFRIFQRLIPIWCISFILQHSPIRTVKMKVVKVLVSQSWPTLCDPMDCSPPGSPVRGDSPGKNTGVGSHSLLQGIFLTQGLNLGFLWCRQILYHLRHQESPLIHILLQTRLILSHLQVFLQAIPTIQMSFHILQLPISPLTSMKTDRPPANQSHPGNPLLALLSRLGSMVKQEELSAPQEVSCL